MAIGALISNRNFTSFFCSGRLWHADRGHLSQRDGRSSGSSPDARRNLLPPKLGDGEEHRDGRSFCAPSRVVPNRKPDLVLCTKLRKTSPALLIHPRRSGKCHCYASSSSYHDSRSALFFKKMSGPYIGRSQKPDIAKASRSRTYYKSEEYDISEIRLEALTTPETSGEVVLAEDNTREELLPWWQDFPKRWAIVLLCFMAFLLCNKDRVSVILLF
ncbi:hypothetical protein MLD38_031268 [Melastoma candidum]|uniref:Uncharacterized protein n=1 Tax=Melastoma candidum TaxID=119954 RepID=A0ACB9MP72_9MYRT|nr:hypothetical protein MLD38_031268 [Melastoma candidum]